MLKRILLGGFAGLGLLISFGVARAIDPPGHNVPAANLQICSNCHSLHNSTGASLTSNPDAGQLCISCHNATGDASGKPFSLGDQAVPGTSGTSHSWNGLLPATSSQSNQYGLRAYADIANAEMKARLATFCNKDINGNCTSYKVTCPVCHDPHSQSVTPWDPNSDQTYTFGVTNNRRMQRMANDFNQMCEDCHYYRTPESVPVPPGSFSQTDVRTWDGKKKSHPIVKNISTDTTTPLQFNGTAPLEPAGASWAPQTTSPRYHGNGGTDTNAANNIAFDSNGKMRCLSCHGVHYTDSNSSTTGQP